MMNAKQKEILQALKFDPISAAEEITGNDKKGDKETAYLSIALQYEKSIALEDWLSLVGDTKMSNKLTDYLVIVQRFGFKVLYTEDFANDRGVAEKMYVMWHDDLSILLCFDTFTWDNESEPNVNSGHVYYNWAPHTGTSTYGLTSSGGFYNEKDNDSHLTLFEKDLSSPYYIPNYPADLKWDMQSEWGEFKKLVAPIDEEQNRLFEKAINEGKRLIWVGNHDCREAIITKLKALFENGTFVKEWKDCAFPWLTHYMDHHKGASMDSFNKYYDKTKFIIAKLPAHVKKCIGSYKF